MQFTSIKGLFATKSEFFGSSRSASGIFRDFAIIFLNIGSLRSPSQSSECVSPPPKHKAREIPGLFY